MKQNKRSPITDKPLRNPGQSLQEQRDDLLNDKLLMPFVMAWFLIVMTGFEWWLYFNPKQRNPILFTILAILFSVYAGFKIWRAWPELRQLRQGIEGEKAVGQFLDRLRELGYQVFHDLQGENFNVDHVIIGPAGIFTIETKTLSKPMRGKPLVEFDGKQILVNGKTLDRDPVAQAKGQASWLKKLLDEITGQTLSVHPVIVFPGWFVEHKPGALRGMWVLEPKALPTFLSNKAHELSVEQIKMTSGHLSRFIRTQEKLKEQ